jgi:hypothetical protein
LEFRVLRVGRCWRSHTKSSRWHGKPLQCGGPQL